jgi:hypothetical protein
MGSILEYPFFQGQGVFNSEAVSVVVEIDEHGLNLFLPILDFFRPLS